MLKKHLIISIAVTIGIFCLAESSSASPYDIVINEIAWMGNASSTNDEWLELKNNTDAIIDLSGWTLSSQDGTPTISLSGIISPQGYFLLERQDDQTVPTITANLIYTGALGNNGEFLELRDNSNNFIDSTDCSLGWFFGDNTTKQTMERINPLLIGDNSNWNHSANPEGTPQAQNSVYNIPSPNNPPIAQAGLDQSAQTNQTLNFDASASSDSDGTITNYHWDFGDTNTATGITTSHSYSTAGIFTVTLTITDNNNATSTDTLTATITTPATTTPSTINPSDLVINEFVSDASTGQKEWIELYNNTTSTINLTGATIEDGTGKILDLSGQISPQNFLTFDLPTNKLNNNGDIIILKNSQNQIIDQVSYGDWDDGNINDNALATSDPDSSARNSDGVDTDTDNNDFSQTITPTKNASNVITPPPVDPPPTSGGGGTNTTPPPTPRTYVADIIINEIFPNPEGSDNEEEFIELKNIGDDPVDLSDWILGDNTSKRYTISADDFPSPIINPNDFFIIKREISKIALNNNGLEIVSLYWPDQTVIDRIEYFARQVEDKSYSADENNDWFWTETPTPNAQNIIETENNPPTAVISASTEVATINEEIIFDATDSTDPENSALTYLWNFGDNASSTEPVINHKYNEPGTYTVQLTATDFQNQSHTAELLIYIDTEINYDSPQLGQIFISEIFPNPEGSDTENEFIELYNPNDWAIDLSGWQIDDAEGGSRPYQISCQSQTFCDLTIGPRQYLSFNRQQTSLAFNNNFDSARLFDSSGNLVDQADYNSVKENFSYAFDFENTFFWQWTDQPTPDAPNIFSFTQTSASFSDDFIEISLEDIRYLEKGNRVKVRGVVAVEPGVLGSQIFYLAGSGIQIYSYKKDFPDLVVGDFIELTGELSEAGNESRIKISQASDITILEKNHEYLPHQMEIAEIGESSEGYLVKVNGEVVEIRGNAIYLDDGNEEVKIYIKQSTGINLRDLNIDEGTQLTITGIVSQTKSGYRLLPRYESDFEIQSGTVKGAQEKSPSSFIKEGINKYLIAIIIFLTATTIGLFWQNHKLKKSGWKIIEE